MISILAQERLLGFTLGSALAGFLVLEQRRRLYDTVSAHHTQSHALSQLTEPVFGRQFRSQFGLLWNEAVDQTFGPVIAYLNSRRL